METLKEIRLIIHFKNFPTFQMNRTSRLFVMFFYLLDDEEFYENTI